MTPLTPANYLDLVQRALAEDVGGGDLTTRATVPADARATATFVARGEYVVAGLDVAAAVFREVDPRCRLTRGLQDGATCAAGDSLATVTGPAAALLTAERTALNFLQHLCGIATLTKRFVDAAGGRARIFDTRKTSPGLRMLEKYAVRCGGGTNHRAGLFDGVLIKDNHIRAAGGILEAVRRTRQSFDGSIEVEAQSLAEVDEALEAGADVIMLDNLSVPHMSEAIAKIARQAVVEISGGVTLSRVAELARLGADRISVGALTHSAPAADISLELEIDVRSTAG